MGGRGGEGTMGGHGGAGVVTDISDDELTIEPLGGRVEELVATIDDDTEFQVRGDSGPRDLEDASIDDIEEGDIVMVLGTQDDSGDSDSVTVTARTIVLLRSGDE